MIIQTIGRDAPRVPEQRHPNLKPHQRAVLHAMIELESNNQDIRIDDGNYLTSNIAVLGDKVGSGKTYVVGNLITSDSSPPREQWRSHNIAPNVSHRWKIDVDFSPITVVLAPHNLSKHWMSHLLTYPGIEIKPYFRSSDELDLKKSLLSDSPPDVVLVSNTQFSKAHALFVSNQIVVKRLIIDECDTIRLNSVRSCASDRPFAAMTWLVTASSHNLVPGNYSHHRFIIRHSNREEHHVITGNCSMAQSAFVRDLMRCTDNRFIPKLFLVSDNAFVNESFQIPEPVVHEVQCHKPLPTRILEGNVSAAVIDRLNAGDLSTALEILAPGRVDNENNIISVAIAHLTRQRDNLLVQKEYVSSREYAHSGGQAARLERIDANLRAVRGRLANIKQRVGEAENCTICFDAFDKKTLVNCCYSSFCLRCITRWMETVSSSTVIKRSTCPMCKQPLHEDNLLVCTDNLALDCETAKAARGNHFVVDGIEFDRSAQKHHNLSTLIRHLARSDETHKILIFSDNTYIFEHTVHKILHENGIPAVELKGHSSSINKKMDQFENAALSALLINISYYGCGMDMSMATDIILLHEIKGSLHDQVIGRALRPPRSMDKPLTIWKFDVDT